MSKSCRARRELTDTSLLSRDPVSYNLAESEIGGGVASRQITPCKDTIFGSCCYLALCPHSDTACGNPLRQTNETPLRRYIRLTDPDAHVASWRWTEMKNRGTLAIPKTFQIIAKKHGE